MNTKVTDQALQVLAGLLNRPESISTSDRDLTEHAFDWWPVASALKKQGKAIFKPEVIVYPNNQAEVSKILKWANEKLIPVTPWGAGSSVVGGPLATAGGILMDVSSMRSIVAIDEKSLHVKVEAGIIGGDLEDYLNNKGYTLNHSPQSLHRSSVGGWVATRASGQFSSKHGNIEDLCVGLRATLPDGTEIILDSAPRMAVGPDLKNIIIGSEGSLGVITEVTMRIFPVAEKRLFETFIFPHLNSGILALKAIKGNGLRPFLLRLYDVSEARHAMKDSSFSHPVLFIGTEGLKIMADAELKACADIIANFGGESIGSSGAAAWMERRFDFSTIEKVLAKPGGLAETIEVSNTWRDISKTYEALKAALSPYVDEVLCHFSHAYSDGVSLYVILIGDEQSAAKVERQLKNIWEIANRTALDTGATLSHHHGIGLARSKFFREALGDGWQLFSQMKKAIDPNCIMNPGKLGF